MCDHIQQGRFKKKFLNLISFIISTLIPGSYLNGLSFFLFLVFLNGKIFNSEEQVSQAIENFLQSKPTTFYKKGIDKLPKKLKIIHNSEYIINITLLFNKSKINV